MAEQRFLSFLGRLGNGLFGFLTRWEDRGRLSALSRWFKLSVLGVLVTVIAACGKKVNEEPLVMCYRVAAVPDAVASDIVISPNPTNGADSVTVTARARVADTGLDSNFVSSAQCWIGNNELNLFDMVPADSAFDDTLEILRATLSVEGLEPGTTWVGIRLETSLSGWGRDSDYLIITEDHD